MENVRKEHFHLITFLFVHLLSICYADKTCWDEHIFSEEKSTVCSCISEYCDELTRQEPGLNHFIVYTSSEGGLRFHKEVKSLQVYYFNSQASTCPLSNYCFPALFLDTKILYQKIEGFGGAVTDAAAINWMSLKNETLKQHLIDSYFSKTGLEYNMIRVPMGGSDFSTRPYAYNDYPENDVRLSNFSLAPEDFNYKLPMIKASIAAATSQVNLLAAPWSPPVWMKTNNNFTGASQLRRDYYQTYAEYYLKFLGAYAQEGVNVWGVSTGNQPVDAILNSDVGINSLGWAINDQANWIANNLGPTLRNSEFKDVKILAVDDQRNQITNFFNLMAFTKNPEALQYIDGLGVHFYLDSLVPPEVLTSAVKDHPDTFIISTEACAGAHAADSPKVDLGSWARAQLYINDIIEDLNYNVTGWIDWNLCLDEEGGPNWVNNFVDSPIIISNNRLKFFKQPTYYALAHFAKFLPRGSRRIHVQHLCKQSIDNVSFLTPRNTIVTMLHNKGEPTTVDIVTCHRLASLELPKSSITTVEFLHEPCR